MDAFAETDDRRLVIKNKLRQYFDGRIVRKDLTKHIKEGANVPVYVLEFLLGQYCSSDDEAIIEQGVQNVKRILADNFVRPDEAQKILSQLRKNGSHTIIDMVTVHLDIKKDSFFAEFSNLGLSNVPITDDYPEKFDRLLCGGIWCIVQLEYEAEGDNNFGVVDSYGKPISSKQKKQKDISPISIRKLTPIQMPHIDIEEVREGRKAFTQDEWIDVMLRSCGYEPDQLNKREKWLLLARMIPLVENNFNLCELGPRSTGKSHIYKEISPNSILVSGGQTTVANLFYNMSRKTVGLVGLWDCVAFDEVAGIKFKDKDGIQIMKDYMASGSFARGKEEKAASASMVFVGNINQSVDVLLKTSSLFDPFPPEMGTDTAFNFLKANGSRISGSISTTMKDYIINYQDLQGIGMTGKLALPTLIALCSIALGRPAVSSLAVLGEISISGTILKVDELANSLQVCLDSGAKKVLLPITSAADLGTVPPELVGSFNLIFYNSAEDAVFKALGVE